MANAAISASILQRRDPWALYRDVEHVWEVRDEGSDVSSSVDSNRQAELSSPSQRMSSILLLQAEVHHGSYHLSWCRHQIDLILVDFNLQWGIPVQLDPSPVTQQYSRQSDPIIPPAQWAQQPARGDGEEQCELFRDPPRAARDPFHDLLEQGPGMHVIVCTKVFSTNRV